MAHALAQRYVEHGIDPKLAYSQDDDVDFGAEFGIN